ncbi:ImmA/IrrE family metallo-endopeptidase [Calditrichota bacterium LG25]
MPGSKREALKVSVKPELLHWAIDRAGKTVDQLVKIFPKIEAWLSGRAQPTLKQLERFANTLHVPFGSLFLDAPPQETSPIPDFRIMPSAQTARPSPELLETIYLSQQRQDWYRQYAISIKESQLSFVGSVSLKDDIKEVAADISERLNFSVEARREIPTWTEAFNRFIDSVEAIGILVMVNSVVGNNTHRSLNPEEFRGFVLVDELATLIFINGADTLSAKTFTLAHELAHVWLGTSGISDASIEGMSNIPNSERDINTERWCNQVAAELLVPEGKLREYYNRKTALNIELNRLARIFKVSTLVILRRLFDLSYLNFDEYRKVYQDELERLLAYERKASQGGDFYRTISRRVSKRFAHALIVSTLEGQTLFRDAYKMLNISKAETFNKFAQSLGVM